MKRFFQEKRMRPILIFLVMFLINSRGHSFSNSISVSFDGPTSNQETQNLWYGGNSLTTEFTPQQSPVYSIDHTPSKYKFLEQNFADPVGWYRDTRDEATKKRHNMQSDFRKAYEGCTFRENERCEEKVKAEKLKYHYFVESRLLEEDCKRQNFSSLCSEEAFNQFITEDKLNELDNDQKYYLSGFLQQYRQEADDLPIDVAHGPLGEDQSIQPSIDQAFEFGSCPIAGIPTFSSDMFDKELLKRLWFTGENECERKRNVYDEKISDLEDEDEVNDDFCNCVRKDLSSDTSNPNYEPIECQEVINATNKTIGREMKNIYQDGLGVQTKALLAVLKDPKILKSNPEIKQCLPGKTFNNIEIKGCEKDELNKIQQVMADIHTSEIMKSKNYDKSQKYDVQEIIQYNLKNGVINKLLHLAPDLLEEKYKNLKNINDNSTKIKLVNEFDFDQLYKHLEKEQHKVSVFDYSENDFEIISKHDLIDDPSKFEIYFNTNIKNNPEKMKLFSKISALKAVTNPGSDDASGGVETFNGEAGSAKELLNFMRAEIKNMEEQYNKYNSDALGLKEGHELLNEALRGVGNSNKIIAECKRIKENVANICSILDTGSPAIKELSIFGLKRGDIRSQNYKDSIMKVMNNNESRYHLFLCQNNDRKELLPVGDRARDFIKGHEICEYDVADFKAENLIDGWGDVQKENEKRDKDNQDTRDQQNMEDCVRRRRSVDDCKHLSYTSSKKRSSNPLQTMANSASGNDLSRYEFNRILAQSRLSTPTRNGSSQYLENGIKAMDEKNERNEMNKNTGRYLPSKDLGGEEGGLAAISRVQGEIANAISRPRNPVSSSFSQSINSYGNNLTASDVKSAARKALEQSDRLIERKSSEVEEAKLKAAKNPGPANDARVNDLLKELAELRDQQKNLQRLLDDERAQRQIAEQRREKINTQAADDRERNERNAALAARYNNREDGASSGGGGGVRNGVPVNVAAGGGSGSGASNAVAAAGGGANGGGRTFTPTNSAGSGDFIVSGSTATLTLSSGESTLYYTQNANETWDVSEIMAKIRLSPSKTIIAKLNDGSVVQYSIGPDGSLISKPAKVDKNGVAIVDETILSEIAERKPASEEPEKVNDTAKDNSGGRDVMKDNLDALLKQQTSLTN